MRNICPSAIMTRRFGNGEDPPVLSSTWKFPNESLAGIAGLAAYNGTLIVGLSKMDELLFIDVAHSRAIGTLPMSHPRGLYADSKGNLFIVSHNTVLKAKLPDTQSANGFQSSALRRFDRQWTSGSPTAHDGLDNNLYVSDLGHEQSGQSLQPRQEDLSTRSGRLVFLRRGPTIQNSCITRKGLQSIAVISCG